MNNNAFCPISYKKTDEHVARLVGLFTLVFIALWVITGSILPLLFLLYDFLVRGFEKPSLSVLAQLSKLILAALKVKPAPINAGPKIFAARIGVLFTVLVLFFSLVGAPVTALVFAGIFAFCAFLESAFGFCVACQIYPILYKLLYQTNFSRGKIRSDWQI